jgi:cbb3-type cytochrome oxidase maturation protein
MIVIFALIIVSLVIVAGFIAAFFWAVNTGQFDDDCTPAIRILLDEEDIPI